MKKMIKYSNTFGFALALCLMVLSGCSCSAPKATPAPDPLAGWQKDYTPQTSDQIIEKDYQAYIHSLSPEEQKFASVDHFFKDGTGQHAVQIVIPLNGTFWEHDLFYDKDNKRVKVIKRITGDYHS